MKFTERLLNVTPIGQFKNRLAELLKNTAEIYDAAALGQIDDTWVRLKRSLGHIDDTAAPQSKRSRAAGGGRGDRGNSVNSGNHDDTGDTGVAASDADGGADTGEQAEKRTWTRGMLVYKVERRGGDPVLCGVEGVRVEGGG